MCALIGQPQDVTSILRRVTERYKNLNGYRLEGSYETSVSNGSTTWTYLPHEKTYTKVYAVTNDTDQEEEESEVSDNLP